MGCVVLDLGVAVVEYFAHLGDVLVVHGPEFAGLFGGERQIRGHNLPSLIPDVLLEQLNLLVRDCLS